MRRVWILWVCAALVSAARTAPAQVRVRKDAAQKSTIDWTRFTAARTAPAALFGKTMQNDLLRSGWFLPAAAGGEFALTGACEDDGSALSAKCTVVGTMDRRTYLNKSYRAGVADARRLAHQAADDIILAVTGQRGFSGTRLALTGNRTGRKEIYLCDADGQNLIQLTKHGSISLSPKWGPNGRTIVYTSYLKGYPDVYLVDVIQGGSPKRVAGYPGLNTGADIAPNGLEMALILSKDGDPDLYVKSLSGGNPTRLTSSRRVAEASPSWSPDGNRIVYVSDASGRPQLYILSRSGGSPKRLTSRGSENVAPDWGPNGWIAYSTKVGNRYQVCVMNPDTLESRQITTEDADYEDPTWAPDGRHLACSRTRAYRSSIYLLDTLGDPPIALLETSGDWFSPSWSPK
jgi:TolB protein